LVCLFSLDDHLFQWTITARANRASQGQTRWMPSDLELAHLLADAADAISSKHFRSEDLLVETKGDGTPVTEVDRAVERAMHALVVEHRPGDAFLGEEIGPSGDSNRRWIFDGIDGTHNYAAGRVGWGTMIALEIDGEVCLGLISSPLSNQRWWAERGQGAWTGPGDDRSTKPTRLHCTSPTNLADATVMVMPPQGFLVGWRSDAAGLVSNGELPRHRSFALDLAEMAMGNHDATVMFIGGVWDLAASVVIIEEAGGTFVNLWGDRRLDTNTGLFAPAAFIPELLARVDDLVPEFPDTPIRAKPIPT
jgi:histidinol-phosphatase